MRDQEVSLTAIMTAYMRAVHATDPGTKIFEDFLAAEFIPEDRRIAISQGIDQALQLGTPDKAAPADRRRARMRFLQALGFANVLSRSRYTEDTLLANTRDGVSQYVILGAGLDTFAFRHRNLRGQVQIFELDHPTSQAFKRKRLVELGWEIPDDLHFIPVDFAQDNVERALARSSYNPQARTLFSLLGVTMYLPRENVFSTLRSLASISPAGSIVIFDYFAADAATSLWKEMKAGLSQIGEPIQTYLNPDELATTLAPLGLALRENLDPAEIQKRYFHGWEEEAPSPTAYIAQAIVQI